MNLDSTRADTTPTGSEYRHFCKSYRLTARNLSNAVLWAFVAQTQVALADPRNAKSRPMLDARLDVVTDLLIERLGPAEWVPARER